MKKQYIIMIFVFLLVISSSYAAKIDSKVEEELKDNDEISVIVMLNEDVGDDSIKNIRSAKRKSGLEQKKEITKIQQDKVLNNLNIRTISKTGTKKEIKTQEEELDLELTHKFSITNGFAGKVTKQGLEKLKNDPNVKSISINGIKHISLAQSTALMNADDIWATKLNGTNLTGLHETICVVDSGIDTDHTAFSGKIVDQYCYCNGNCCPDNTAEDDNAEDDNGHGTHVAGIAAGNSSTVKGVAPDAKIVAIKVCNSAGNCNDADMINGIEWCTNNASKYNISVISVSIGGGEFSSYCDNEVGESGFADPINTAVGQNISVIVASGNDANLTSISSPACIENATPIGDVYDANVGGLVWGGGTCTDSSTAADQIVCHSNRGILLDLLAPGALIVSSYTGGGTSSEGGTSMAAPHASGAVALIKQFVRLQNGTDIIPSDIDKILNNTGTEINDVAQSGRRYKRIDILAAITALDTIVPIISFTSNSPSNNSYTASNFTLINISSNENLNSAWIQMNNTNTSMSGSGISWSINISQKWGFPYTYTVFGNDSAGNLGNSTTRTIYMVNSAPNATSVTTSSTDSLNRTNGTLSGSWSFSDINQDSQTDNETRWYNNTKYLFNLDNLTSISSQNTTKNDIWVFSVRVYDSLNWSSWINSSNFTIKNAAPVLSIVKNQTIANETGLINITVSASDLDSDSLTYGINHSSFTQSTNMFTWSTNLTNSGTYFVRINVTDGTDVDFQDFVITILDSADFDNDSNPDFNDTDDDNDGIDDNSDYLTGNLSNINSTTTIRLRINNSENVTRILNGTLPINITDANNNSIVEFNWNFTNSTLVINWTVDYNSSGGYIRIKNIDLSSKGITKTVYINKSNSNFNYVCIADDETTDPATLDSSCSTKVQCTTAGTTSGSYTCTEINGTFKVEGLSNSAVRGVQYTPPSGSTSSGGGGGGGGSSAKTYDLGKVTFSGSSQKIKKDEKIKFVFKSEIHSIRALKVEAKSATIIVASTPKIITLQEEQSQNFNFDGDGYFDVNITLHKIINKAANISIKEIHEPIIRLIDKAPEEVPKEEPKQVEQQTTEPEIKEETPKNKSNAWIYTLVIVLIIIATTIYIKRKNISNTKTKKYQRIR